MSASHGAGVAHEPDVLETLKVLYAAATNGTWRLGSPIFRCVMDHDGESHGNGKCRYTIQGWYDSLTDITLDNAPVVSDEEVRIAGQLDYDTGGIAKPEDAKLIVALHNAFPELCRRISETQAKLDERVLEVGRLQGHRVCDRAYAIQCRELLQEVRDGVRTTDLMLATRDGLPLLSERIDAALAKSPNPSGHFATEASGPNVGVPPEASGPVGLGPIESGLKDLTIRPAGEQLTVSIPNYQERCKQARTTKAGDVWRHLKTGKEVVVIGRVGYYGIQLSHPSGRKTVKLDHYLAGDFCLLVPDEVTTTPSSFNTGKD